MEQWAGSACGRPERRAVAEIAGGLPPFDELHDVHLGMTAADVRRVRPAARPAAYTGLVEETSRGRIVYLVPGSYAEGQSVPPDHRSESVAATTYLPTDSAAHALWRATIADAGARLGAPLRCVRITGASSEGLEAMWRRSDAALTISVFDMRRLARTEGDSAVVRAVVAEYSADLEKIDGPQTEGRQSRPRRVQVTCP